MLRTGSLMKEASPTTVINSPMLIRPCIAKAAAAPATAASRTPALKVVAPVKIAEARTAPIPARRDTWLDCW